MVLEQDRAIQMYYEQVKHLYPDMPYADFHFICKYPSRFIKACIRNTDLLPIIHIKYLGKFKIYPGRLKKFLNEEVDMLRRGILTQAEFDHNQKFLKAYLSKIEHEQTHTVL